MHWQIQSDSDTAGDFLALAGSVIILEGQRDGEIVLSLMPDVVPELEELYTVRLTAVEGGATLDANPNLVSNHIRCVIYIYNTYRHSGRTKVQNNFRLILFSDLQGAC